VVLVNSAGCDSAATLILTVNPTPPAPTVNSPISYCQFNPAIVLSATGTYPLLWYSGATGGIGSGSAPVPFTGMQGVTNYYVSQVNGVCESPRSVITVTVNRKPVLGNDKSLKICFNSTADLTSLYNTNGFNTSWTLNQVPLTNPSSVSVAGTYQLISSNIAGCSDTALVRLSINPEVVANAGPDGNAEYNIPYPLHGSGGGSYEWSPGSPRLNNPYISSPFATITDDTQFILMVTDDIGCTDYDTVKLRVFKGPTFYVPTAFTPNGDGVNDIFRPTAVGIVRLDFFRVFNRYGELVYETQELNKGWDGTFKGQKQPINNYVWSIQGLDRMGVVKFMRGNVVLIR
jgi:gliding motility-associated-like protein